MDGENSKTDIYVCIGPTVAGMRDLMAFRDERISRGAFCRIAHEYLKQRQDSFPAALRLSEIEDYRTRFPNMVVMQALQSHKNSFDPKR